MNGNDFLALLIDSLKSPPKRDRINIVRYLFEHQNLEVESVYDAERAAGKLFRISDLEIRKASQEAEKLSEEYSRRGISIVSFFSRQYPASPERDPQPSISSLCQGETA